MPVVSNNPGTVNGRYVVGPNVYLSAMGYSAGGSRSGGIVAPRLVTLDRGLRLIRVYSTPGEEFGQWWVTRAELRAVFDYFSYAEGMGGSSAAALGRSKGRSILHGVLTIRHDWMDTRRGQDPADHLSRFVEATVAEPLVAFAGAGYAAPSADQSSVQKPLNLHGDAQGGLRQLFLPSCWEYKDAFEDVRLGFTDAGLRAALHRP